MPYTQVANLDFEDIKVALKDYMRAQTDFTDYDFEGSALSNLIDVLAYNTYYTAFNTNMVVNELFIDSATLRDNVVAIAKQLGYRPKSATSPTAYVSFTVNYTNPTTDTELLLKKGSGFIASYDNNVYQYVVLDDVKAQVVNDVATFTDVAVNEGTQLINTFTVNTALKGQRFILDNQNIDTNTIRVQVYPTGGSFSEPYLVADNILGVDGNSKVFFLDEIEDERYEILMGDGVLGKKLENNARIEVSYLTTSGPESNGVRTFVFSGVLENPNGVSPSAFTTNITSTTASAVGEARVVAAQERIVDDCHVEFRDRFQAHPVPGDGADRDGGARGARGADRRGARRRRVAPEATRSRRRRRRRAGGVRRRRSPSRGAEARASRRRRERRVLRGRRRQAGAKDREQDRASPRFGVERRGRGRLAFSDAEARDSVGQVGGTVRTVGGRGVWVGKLSGELVRDAGARAQDRGRAHERRHLTTTKARIFLKVVTGTTKS